MLGSLSFFMNLFFPRLLDLNIWQFCPSSCSGQNFIVILDSDHLIFHTHSINTSCHLSFHRISQIQSFVHPCIYVLLNSASLIYQSVGLVGPDLGFWGPMCLLWWFFFLPGLYELKFPWLPSSPSLPACSRPKCSPEGCCTWPWGLWIVCREFQVERSLWQSVLLSPRGLF